MHVRKGSRASGFTLIEVAMVALIVGLIAAIALPLGNNADIEKVASAASEVATGLRFARAESIRTGIRHGVRQQGGANRFRVYRIDGTGTLIYDIHHPMSKQIWDIQFDVSPHYRGIDIERTNTFRYDACNKKGNIAFRDDGTPLCTDPDTVLLEQGILDLVSGTIKRSVYIDGYTGRVWVQ